MCEQPDTQTYIQTYIIFLLETSAYAPSYDAE